MKRMRLKPVGLILAGGQSKRLFPEATPKPLLKTNGKFLLALALERLKGFDSYIVCNQPIARQIRMAFRAQRLKVPQFIIEPEGRDTAAAVGFGLSALRKKNPPWVAVISADHWVKENHLFPPFFKRVEQEVLRNPESLFVCGSLPETKESSAYSMFGWIVPKGKSSGLSSEVKVFVEKPEGARLKNVRSRGGLINAGMFFGSYATFVEAFEKHYPDVMNSKVKYKNLPRIPVDRAIFEKFQNVRVIPLSIRWEDLGTWADWHRFVGIDKKPSTRILDSENVFAYSDEDHEIYSFANKNLAIIQSGSKILVMPLSRTQEMKQYLERLR